MNVLVTGVGGPTPRSFVRAVRQSGRESLAGLRFVGVDCNPLAYGLYENQLFDAAFLIPRADHPDYWDHINHLIDRENIQMAVVLPEQEVMVWAENPDKLARPVLTHLPHPALVSALIDKHRLHVQLADTTWIPRFIRIDPGSYNYSGIVNQVGENFWIRGTVGSSGFGSLQIPNADVLDNWIRINSTIEEFIASEFLPGRNLACKLLYFHGQIKRTACAERVHYIMSKVAPSGITGNTSFGRLLNHPELVAISEAIMTRISGQIGVQPHGIFTLDFKEDREGVPLLTEINIRHVAFNSSIAVGGANLPADTLEILQIPDTSKVARIDYQFPEPLVFLRDVDGAPIVRREAELFSVDQVSIVNRTNVQQSGDRANSESLRLADLRRVVNQVLSNSNRPLVTSLQLSTRLQEDLGLDSLELAELTVRLEAEFGVDVFRGGMVRTAGEVVAKLLD